MTKSPANEWEAEFSGFGGDPHNPFRKQDWSSIVKSIRLSLLSELEEKVKGMVDELPNDTGSKRIWVNYADVLSLINNLKKEI